jgi:hypothetical protein
MFSICVRTREWILAMIDSVKSVLRHGHLEEMVRG